MSIAIRFFLSFSASYMHILGLLFFCVKTKSTTPLDDLFDESAAKETKSFMATPQAMRSHPLQRISLISGGPSMAPPAVYEGAHCKGPYNPHQQSCQVFAENACYNPFLPQASALALQTSVDAGLGGDAARYTFTSCQSQYCDSSECDNPALPGTKGPCLSCLQACMTYCLVNHELLCTQKVCAATVATAAHTALQSSVAAESAVNPITAVEKGSRDEARLAEAVGVSVKKLAQVQERQLSSWMKSFVQPDAVGGAGLCSYEALKASDTNVIADGFTYTSALISCASNFFTPELIDSTSANSSKYQADMSCQLIDQCPRNNQQVAIDRAIQVWNTLAAPYR